MRGGRGARSRQEPANISCRLFNNTICNRFVGLEVPVENVSVAVQAPGNTWFPNAQGADAQGHYPSMQISGPVSGANVNLGSFINLQL